MKKLPLVLLSASLLVGGFQATSQAAIFDFVAEAAGDERTLLEDGAANVFSNAGVTVTLTANNLNGAGNPLPYLDDVINPNLPGGLGVCQSFLGDCGSDDNITQGEIITLSFDQEVTLGPLRLSNGEHLPIFTGNFGIVIDDAPSLANFSNLANQYTPVDPFLTQLTGTVFHFVANSTLSGVVSTDRQLYLNVVNATPVPLPGVAVLFGTGVAALGWWRRKMASPTVA